MKYKHIVFDVDGTLVDTEYAVLHSLQDTLRILSGKEIPCAELEFALGITGIDALKILEIPNISHAIGLWEKILRNYFTTIVCADDTQEHKPNAAPLLKYVQLSEIDYGEVLYIGDSEYDSKCAENAGIDFALAVWGSHGRRIKADYFLERPADLLSVMTAVS